MCGDRACGAEGSPLESWGGGHFFRPGVRLPQQELLPSCRGNARVGTGPQETSLLTATEMAGARERQAAQLGGKGAGESQLSGKHRVSISKPLGVGMWG